MIEFILFIFFLFLGGTLQGFLRQMQSQMQRLDLKTVTDFFHDIISGIAFMHSQKIIHADLKSKCASKFFLYGACTFVITDCPRAEGSC